MSCNPKVTGSGKAYGSGSGNSGSSNSGGSGGGSGGGAGGGDDPYNGNNGSSNPLKPTEKAGNLRFNKEQAAEIRSELKARGYSDVQVAAIMGHWYNESSFNTTALGDNGTSFGLAQWHKTRWEGLKEYSAKNGLDPSSVKAQVGYFDWELNNTERRAGTMLKNSTDIRDASWAMNNFERFAGYKNSGGESAERYRDSLTFYDYYNSTTVASNNTAQMNQGML